jgi:hypothetical protein
MTQCASIKIGVMAVSMAAALLAGCGDKPQSMGGVKSDAAPYTGASNAHVVPGWQAGDKTSWEQQLRARAQYGQNEYTRAQ